MRSVLILCSLLSFSTVLFGADGASFDISPRQDLNFSTGWVFIPKDLPGVEQPGFDDYSFERVSVPHANILTPHETFVFRLPKWFASYALASQSDPLIYGPMVKILSSWRNNGRGKIYVASNASEVELLVNGKSLGRAKPMEFPHAPHIPCLFSRSAPTRQANSRPAPG
jgi:hypothetical protein